MMLRHHRGPQHRPPRVYIGPSVARSYLAIKPLPGRHGNALFARVALAANTRIEVVGVRIHAAQRDRLVQRSQEQQHRHRQLASYIVAAGRRGEFIDGHPRHEGSSTWFASRANEPDPDIAANMLLVAERAVMRPVLVTVRAVAANEQLTVHYGAGYRRDYRVGRRARRPTWL